MLSHYLNKDGILFTVSLNGRIVHFNEWPATDDCIYYFPLSTLVDNGHACASKEGCLVPFESIYLIDEDDRVLLGVPGRYNRSMRLRADGVLNSSDFKYKLELLSHLPDGDLINAEIGGNILHTFQRDYLLDEDQYDLYRRVSAFNQIPELEKSIEFNFREFAEIKQLAISCGCSLDSYLENENVSIPERIQLEVGKDEDGFYVKPSAGTAGSDKFTSAFDKMRKVQNVYPIQNEKGERVRILINPEQKKGLEYLKERKCHFKDKDEIKNLIENPTEYFNPDEFNVEEFYSDRVIEIGVYKPKFYPFVCPYKSCWIVGAKVETPANGSCDLLIESEEELVRLREAIHNAKELKTPVVNYKETDIDIEDAEFLADSAESQLKNPHEPFKTESTKPERKVLIIEENAETLGYVVKERKIEQGDHYYLFSNPALRPDYSLKDHQEEGIAWLQHMYKSKASGCLMADDMGLGKTLQILYFIDWHSRTHRNHKPYLIVAPVSLLENWEQEYNRFFSAPRMSILRLTSKEVPRKFDKSCIKFMLAADVILTNYESLRISQLNFCAVQFDIVVLDEAQKIKSPGTLVTNAAKALKANFKVAMTGTPVENSLLDLWCIMDFCVPGLLGNAKAFAAQYQNPLKNEDVDLVSLGNELHDRLGIYFIRRLKKDVAKDLPEKFELKEECNMPEIQENTYLRAMQLYLNGTQTNMLLTIQDIREISEHPYLYDSTLPTHDDEELIATSARLKVTIGFIERIRTRGEKVIVFAERKETQKMLQRIFFEKYGVVAKIINGDTPSLASNKRDNRETRQASIDAFQAVNGFNIIIMSPIAAGMGLNVIAANHVIHYSRHWNPAKESQATDRAYRIGQTKDVYVYYPMAVSPNFISFDKTLDGLLGRKTALATSTIFPTERAEVKLADFENLFK